MASSIRLAMALAPTDRVAWRAKRNSAAWTAAVVWAPLTIEMSENAESFDPCRNSLSQTIVMPLLKISKRPDADSAVVFTVLLTFLVAFSVSKRVTQIRTKQGTAMCVIEVQTVQLR